jgi:peptide/nickel transport system permease protein
MKSGREFLHSFVRHKLAMIGLIIFLAEIVLVLVLPPVMHLDPTAIDSTHFSAAPGGSHILGTDDVGRDMFARVVCGGRISILIGVAATAISVVIGLPLGLFAGYYRGKAETIIMRAADIFLSFPSMVLILVIVAVFGSSIPALIILIGVLNWPAIAKLIYGNVLSVRSMEYVEAERAIGTPSLKILFQTVMPNSIAPLWVSLSFRISNAMITESALSFLGARRSAADTVLGQYHPERHKPCRSDTALVDLDSGRSLPGCHDLLHQLHRRGCPRCTGSEDEAHVKEVPV